MVEEKSQREQLLDTAKEIICKRSAIRGKPENSFRTIALLWMDYLEATSGLHINLDSADVAVMMTLLKIARIARQRDDKDSWADGAGYIACGYEAMIHDLGEQ